MIVLALDTAGTDCAAALYDTATMKILGEVTENIGRGHAERLMAIVDLALDQAGVDISDVGRIAVTVGPGSFTGIRVGVAAARGFALSLGVESVGISTLEVLAAEAIDRRRREGDDDGRPILVSIDARRGEVYLQLFSATGRPLQDASVLSVDAAREIAASGAAEVVGSAASLLAGNEVATSADHFPIARVAQLAIAVKPGKPRPLYLRGPDAKPQEGFAVARV
ncbi:tRNA (adenosine(37)-N6)-threonylcarbamoyltransferase complex dimerization subunit type 1 TsaB [Ciceribacter sp. L1K22]|uniref:tRNA (adenosine(37)-N6)-threonylcarbamoyltransferase complex dimerization subunit type 1 TsaB n=1 Tax=Ciceribacter sp. L1K22 TaxID=2820275 RepID=UPI001ABE0053|nr:tRNA (adenosine(37)-N6)-threonylcarbamoyltransferase complex dimerization subunit type 1 TsaB [Ciceribacter sp. L1K22]MBO3758808.1 tRNA (adenosine(37)-N6)-threonylcarbamoyltransferase complex dimerization subunit type 1 TsaB [Ciceribacter sp. L1K22]